MTPQQLMDLRGYGNAEKQLKAQGDWDYATHWATGSDPIELTIAFEHGFSVSEEEPLTITIKAH